ncbi:MAG: trypsin-like peptidase domain-containing protein [SAR202 cluster bacterium]|nr:trypsin-like peptidase domain-containing protein [SAR202 cluster bacterium]
MIGGGSDLPKSPGAERERIVVDLALRPGYSGGPLVDHQGTLIGMSILMTGQEVGMAVPSHVIGEFVAKASSADWSGSGTILV